MVAAQTAMLACTTIGPCGSLHRARSSARTLVKFRVKRLANEQLRPLHARTFYSASHYEALPPTERERERERERESEKERERERESERDRERVRVRERERSQAALGYKRTGTFTAPLPLSDVLVLNVSLGVPSAHSIIAQQQR